MELIRFNSFNTEINNNKNEIKKGHKVSFKGMSQAPLYENAIDYMAASIIDTNKKLSSEIVRLFHGKPLGAHQIKNTIMELFKKNLVFTISPPDIDITKIKFAVGVQKTLKQSIKNIIDKTRKATMLAWQEIITNNTKKVYFGVQDNTNGNEKETIIYIGTRKIKNYFDTVKENPVLQFVIWLSFMDDLKEKNRHIPPPVNPKVMQKTVEYFKELPKNKYAAEAFGVSKFRDKYQEELINNAIENIFINKNNEFSKIQVFDNNGQRISSEDRQNINYNLLEGIWVEIPNKSKDSKHPNRNILLLEQLSHPNWCTKSRSDMASAYLRKGKLLLYLKHDKGKNLWTSELGIIVKPEKDTNYIVRIQGKKNDNLVPAEYKNLILKFIEKNNYKCLNCRANEEGMFAAEQLGISEKK